MKLNAVGVNSKDIQKSIDFYSLLGFQFPSFKVDEPHIESIPHEGSIKLMIDSAKLAKEIIGEEPKPGNHSSFAIEYDTSEELNSIVEKLKALGYIIVKEPWNAEWGQRYAIVEDPDGYKVDLYAELIK